MSNREKIPITKLLFDPRTLSAIMLIGVLAFATGLSANNIYFVDVEEEGTWHNEVTIEVTRTHSWWEYYQAFGARYVFDMYILQTDQQLVYNVLTNEGKDWIEDQMSDAPNATEILKYIGLSDNATAPDATWNATEWHDASEITGNGLARAAGTYASTGVGSWTVQKQFTATGTQSNVQISGLLQAADADGNEKLVFIATFTLVNLLEDDQITLTWSASVT